MVSPEPFFTTLAQATAASIGFILAFIAVSIAPENHRLLTENPIN